MTKEEKMAYKAEKRERKAAEKAARIALKQRSAELQSIIRNNRRTSISFGRGKEKKWYFNFNYCIHSIINS